MKYLGSISDSKDLVNKGYVDDSLEAVFKWLGVTTTSITDGSSTNPITINNESVIAIEGSVVGYNNSEFLFDGSNWKELGKDEPIAFESFSGLSSISIVDTFTYGSYTYYKGYKGSVISAFPHYTGSSFRLEMESLSPTIPPTINTYDGYYVSYSSGGTTYPVICAGTGDESSITSYPLYLIVITTESGSKYYTIYSRGPNNAIPAWVLYEENKNKEIIIEQELKEDSTNLVTNGVVAKNINGLNEEVDELKRALSYVEENTKNLWTNANDTETSGVYGKNVPIALSSGTYTIFVSEINTTFTGSGARIEFYDSTDTRMAVINESITTPASENYLIIQKDGTRPQSLTLGSACSYVKLYAANTASNSNGKTATWKGVMIVRGKYNDKGNIIPLLYEPIITANAFYSVRKPLIGKTVVNFGDSIFGNFTAPTDLTSYISAITGATAINVGFGGTRMTDNSEYGDKGYFSMCKLAEAIAAENASYPAQTAALGRMSGEPLYDLYNANLNKLKAIDFTKVDIITIEQCTNDYYGDVRVTNEGSSSHLVFDNAMRYVIDTISTAFPNIRIIVIGPIYRWFSSSSDSNNYANNKGYTLIDFKNKMQEIAEEYNLQFIDDYYLGINKYTYAKYLSDGTHPTDDGRVLIGNHIAHEMYGC